MAAREQREHQRFAAPISAEVLRPLPSHTARARRRRLLAQHEASTDDRLDDTISGVRPGCCGNPLRTHPISPNSRYPLTPGLGLSLAGDWCSQIALLAESCQPKR